jgi:hypothetical protein
MRKALLFLSILVPAGCVAQAGEPDQVVTVSAVDPKTDSVFTHELQVYLRDERWIESGEGEIRDIATVLSHTDATVSVETTPYVFNARAGNGLQVWLPPGVVFLAEHRLPEEGSWHRIGQVGLLRSLRVTDMGLTWVEPDRAELWLVGEAFGDAAFSLELDQARRRFYRVAVVPLTDLFEWDDGEYRYQMRYDNSRVAAE